MLIYVDDILIYDSDSSEIYNLKDMLSQTFHMKDLVPLRYFLGPEVERTSDGFFLSPQKYIKDLIQEYSLLSANPLKLLLEANIKLTRHKSDPLPGR